MPESRVTLSFFRRIPGHLEAVYLFPMRKVSQAGATTPLVEVAFYGAPQVTQFNADDLESVASHATPVVSHTAGGVVGDMHMHPVKLPSTLPATSLIQLLPKIKPIFLAPALVPRMQL